LDDDLNFFVTDSKFDAHLWDSTATVLEGIENPFNQCQLDFSQAFRSKMYFCRQLICHPGGFKLIVMSNGDFELNAL
jgi:hypothetical protein